MEYGDSTEGLLGNRDYLTITKFDWNDEQFLIQERGFQRGEAAV